jgi:hypothetical protein
MRQFCLGQRPHPSLLLYWTKAITLFGIELITGLFWNFSYQKVLEPLGFNAVHMEDNELAIKPRKVHIVFLIKQLLKWPVYLTIGKLDIHLFDLSFPFQGCEKLGRWKRCGHQSSLWEKKLQSLQKQIKGEEHMQWSSLFYRMFISLEELCHTAFGLYQNFSSWSYRKAET